MKIWRRFLRFIPVILVMGIIFFLSHQQGAELPLPPIPGLDKLVHALAYGVLAWTAILVFPPATRRRRTLPVALTVIAFCMLHGITDEVHQSFIPGRTASAGDLIADTAGALLIVYGWTRFAASGKTDTVRVGPGFRS